MHKKYLKNFLFLKMLDFSILSLAITLITYVIKNHLSLLPKFVKIFKINIFILFFYAACVLFIFNKSKNRLIKQ